MDKNMAQDCAEILQDSSPRKPRVESSFISDTFHGDLEGYHARMSAVLKCTLWQEIWRVQSTKPIRKSFVF